ncbi:hypothetical protein [Cellulomonas taurus]|uniref:hypothetical protein n=1 Tax=Cellulomonas taurus TaxID=2729175 RepID=UPI00198060C4|nr:hypothetical protein [Cellulomonas taurus]
MTTTTDREERIALARAALATAELRTGARQAVSELRPMASPRVPPRADTQMTSIRAVAPPPPTSQTPTVASAAASTVASTVHHGSVLLTDRPPLPAPPALTPLLPDGLRRGSTIAVLGSTSLVLAMIAAACTTREAWAAVVGQPSIGLLAAQEAGVGLDRLALVPRPGPDAPSVLAALLDGLDVVLVGPGAALRDTDRRRLMARARDRGSVLLATTPWPGASCVLTVTGGRWTGPGEGDGRLRARELHLTRTGRGAAGGRPEELSLVLPYDGHTDPYGLPAPEQPRIRRTDTGLRLVG